MFTINYGDIFRGIVVAILTGAFLAVSGTLSSVGFDVFTADWVQIGKTVVNGGFAAFIGYIVKNLITANNGKVLGTI